MPITLQKGDDAPDFEALDQHAQPFRLSDHKDKTLILFFYPQDDTPGCTANACNLRDNYEQLQQLGLLLVGISPDHVQSHSAFAQKYGFQFSLLADPDKQILSAYGAWGEKNMYGKIVQGVLRSTFIVRNGKIHHVIKKVDTKNATAQLLKFLPA